MPPDYSQDFTYLMFSTGYEADEFSGGSIMGDSISNGDCRFAIEIFDTATMGPPNPIFSAVQPKRASMQSPLEEPFDPNWVGGRIITLFNGIDISRYVEVATVDLA